jgi:hypothetical protein
VQEALQIHLSPRGYYDPRSLLAITAELSAGGRVVARDS